jgi:hypothetical protein
LERTGKKQSRRVDYASVYKEMMNGTDRMNYTQRPLAKPVGRRYLSGFSVYMFIVLLAIFTWVVHRRVTQYEAMQTGSHHMTATKVCLTERPQISVPTVQSAERGSMLCIVLTFVFALLLCDDTPSSLIRRGSSPRFSRTRIRPCLAHFFFLPPPTSSS